MAVSKDLQGLAGKATLYDEAIKTSLIVFDSRVPNVLLQREPNKADLLLRE